MRVKIVERFCIAMVLMQVVLAWDPRFTRDSLGDFPQGMIFVIFGLLGFISAVFGIGILLKQLINHQTMNVGLLLACGLTFSITVVVQISYGWQNFNFKKANDYSTDIVNPPQFQQTKHERLIIQDISSIWQFFDIPHKITKADIGSIVLPLSGLDSKIVLKRVIERSSWKLSSYSTSSSDGVDFSETYEFRGSKGNPVSQLTDLSVRIASTEAGFSVIDIRSSSRVRYRDLGANSNVIRQLTMDILMMAKQYKNAPN